MTFTRTRLITLAALVAVLALAGVAFVGLPPGGSSTLQLSSSSNVIRIEAAGVNYSGWPEMNVSVNGESIGSLSVDQQQRKMYTLDVPSSVGEISSIEVSFPNSTDCQQADFSVMSSCTNRSLIVRGLYLNDEKLEGGVPSGEKNMASLLQTSEGGITWTIAK